MMIPLFNIVCSFSAFIFLSSPALAADVAWDNGGSPDTNWGNALNWDTNALPTSDDSVFINAGNSATFTAATGSQVIDELFVGDSGAASTLTISGGTLEVDNQQILIGRFGNTGNLNITGGTQ